MNADSLLFAGFFGLACVLIVARRDTPTNRREESRRDELERIRWNDGATPQSAREAGAV